MHGQAIGHVETARRRVVLTAVVVQRLLASLAQDGVARRHAALRFLGPHQHAVVAGVCHAQTPLPEGHGMRPAQAASADPPGVFVAVLEVGLADHPISRLAMRPRQAVIAQHSAVTGVGHPQSRAVPEHAVRPVKRVRRRPVGPAVDEAAAQFGLADDDIGRLMAAARCAVPNQHTVIPGVGHRQAFTAGADAGGHVEALAMHLALGVAPFAAIGRLSDQPFRRRVVALRQRRPAQQPVMAGVGHPERAVGRHRGTPRAEERVRRRHDGCRQGRLAAQHHARTERVQRGQRGRPLAGARQRNLEHHSVSHAQPSSFTATRPSRTRTACTTSCTSGTSRHSPLSSR